MQKMQLALRNCPGLVLAAIVVLVSLAVADYVSWLRLKPEVSAIR
jgi:hypothetical protein